MENGGQEAAHRTSRAGDLLRRTVWHAGLLHGRRWGVLALQLPLSAEELGWPEADGRCPPAGRGGREPATTAGRSGGRRQGPDGVATAVGRCRAGTGGSRRPPCRAPWRRRSSGGRGCRPAAAARPGPR